MAMVRLGSARRRGGVERSILGFAFLLLSLVVVAFFGLLVGLAYVVRFVTRAPSPRAWARMTGTRRRSSIAV
jgi:hypothetical protein